MMRMRNENDLFGYIPKTNNNDSETLILLLLTILQEYYDKYSSKAPEYVINNIDKDIDNLKKELLDLFDEKYNEYVDKIVENNLDEYLIPITHSKLIEYDIVTTENVFRETVDSLLSQLRLDAKTKALVWIDTSKPITEFELDNHFKKATLKLRNAGTYYTQTTNSKIRRGVLDFVYKEATYDWVCLGHNPCSWCIEQSKMPPRILDEIPYDHLHGYCSIVLHEGTYSKEYLDIRG